MKTLGVQRMYVRLFDVDMDEHTHHTLPVAPVRIPAPLDSAYEYVPVIFITQRTLAALPVTDIDGLAGQISALASSLCANWPGKITEVQIDCDWSYTTRDTYFKLLQSLRKQELMRNRKLSCTIRMHQVKYLLRSGTPPADKGLLMCYNMGNMKKVQARNSILNVDEAKDYLSHLDHYPLPLDIALPVFEWCRLFRDGQFKGILRDVSPAEVKNCGLFTSSGENHYLCTHDSLWHDFRLRAGDVVHTESAEYNDLRSIASYTAAHVQNDTMNVTFFSCDSITLSKYSPDGLEAIYNIYH